MDLRSFQRWAYGFQERSRGFQGVASAFQVISVIFLQIPGGFKNVPGAFQVIPVAFRECYDLPESFRIFKGRFKRFKGVEGFQGVSKGLHLCSRKFCSVARVFRKSYSVPCVGVK